MFCVIVNVGVDEQEICTWLHSALKLIMIESVTPNVFFKKYIPEKCRPNLSNLSLFNP